MRKYRLVYALIISSLVFPAFIGCGSSSSTGQTAATQMKWNEPVSLSTGEGGDASDGKLAIDANNNGFVVWQQASHLYASSFLAGGSWSEPEKVDNAVLRTSAFDVAMNAAGDGVLVWRSEESNPVGDYFTARRFDTSTGWDSQFKLLDGSSSDGQWIDAAVSPTGAIMTVFARYSASHVNATGYSTSQGWEAAATRIDDAASTVNYPQIAGDGAGNAMAVWEQYDGSHTNAHACFFSASQGWKDSVDVLDDTSTNVDRVKIFLNADGDGLALWTQDGNKELVARLVSADTWGAAPVMVDAGTGGIYSFEAGAAPDGTLVLVWLKYDNSTVEVYSKTYKSATGWSQTVSLSGPEASADRVASHAFSMNGLGEALVLWSREGETTSPVSARWYNPETGWSEGISTAMAAEEGVGVDLSDLRLLDDGEAVAIINEYVLPDYEDYTVKALLYR